MSDLEEQLNSILSDPGQMAQLQALAQSLMGGGGEPPPAESPSGPAAALSGQGAMLGRLGKLLGAQGGQDDKAALLTALRPYLSQQRQERLARAMRLAKMARLAKLALGEMSDDQTL